MLVTFTEKVEIGLHLCVTRIDKTEQAIIASLIEKLHTRSTCIPMSLFRYELVEKAIDW